MFLYVSPGLLRGQRRSRGGRGSRVNRSNRRAGGEGSDECVRVQRYTMGQQSGSEWPGHEVDGRGLHSSTVWLNLSAFCGIGGECGSSLGGV